MSMKKTLMTLFVCLISTTVFADSPKTIRISNGEWAPYMSENSAHYGLASHIVSEAFKLEGITVE